VRTKVKIFNSSLHIKYQLRSQSQIAVLDTIIPVSTATSLSPT